MNLPLQSIDLPGQPNEKSNLNINICHRVVVSPIIGYYSESNKQL